MHEEERGRQDDGDGSSQHPQLAPRSGIVTGCYVRKAPASKLSVLVSNLVSQYAAFRNAPRVCAKQTASILHPRANCTDVSTIRDEVPNHLNV